LASLRFSNRAWADLAALTSYIAVDSPDRALIWKQRIVERCRSLKGSPFQGRMRPELGSEVRSIAVQSVVVVYRVHEMGRFVEVVRVIDGRRDLGTLSFASWSASPVTTLYQNAGVGGMLQPKNDPFFEQLKADVQEAIDECDRGETISEEEMWRNLYAAITEIERNERGHR